MKSHVRNVGKDKGGQVDEKKAQLMCHTASSNYKNVGSTVVGNSAKHSK